MKIGAIDSSSIEAMIAQLKASAAKAQGPQDASPVAGVLGTAKAEGAGGGGFAAALKASLDAVSGSQGKAEAIGKQFALGDDSVNLSDVMIAGQKASLSFQATVQVRNKLVSAYQEMMSMQV